MSDLYVDMETLDRVRRNIDRIAELMKRPGREMEEVDGWSMGVDALASRMDEFGDEWSYGIGQIEKFSDAASEALLKIKQEFQRVDGELADALPRSSPRAGGQRT